MATVYGLRKGASLLRKLLTGSDIFLKLRREPDVKGPARLTTLGFDSCMDNSHLT